MFHVSKGPGVILTNVAMLQYYYWMFWYSDSKEKLCGLELHIWSIQRFTKIHLAEGCFEVPIKGQVASLWKHNLLLSWSFRKYRNLKRWTALVLVGENWPLYLSGCNHPFSTQVVSCLRPVPCFKRWTSWRQSCWKNQIHQLFVSRVWGDIE